MGKSETLQIDPKCFQDALRTFFQPIKNDDPRLDFYRTYRKEATEYDVDYVKKYDEDLNTTLIFAGLFSAVSSAFVIDIHHKLQPDPNDQSAALLLAILLTLNHSESPAVPPVQERPPSEIVTATGLMFASLLMSLLAAFVAMLGKQWLNRYLRHAGGSVAERCGDRQRKYNGLEKWPFHLFVGSLPVMLQISLLLLACGLCRYMISINTPVAYTLITLTGLGVLFYIAIALAGASSYECPFQTPASIPLRYLWTKAGLLFTPVLSPITTILRAPGDGFRSYISSRLSLGGARRQFDSLSGRIQRELLPRSFRHAPLATAQQAQPPPGAQKAVSWFAPGELDLIRMRNNDDVRCVSWVLRNITDPEALDAAVRLAGKIRWFDDGTDVEPVYDIIVSIFRACFGSDREVYPGSRDRAYHSGRAIVWIHTLAVCKSEESARTFPLPATRYTAPVLDPDLTHLLHVATADRVDRDLFDTHWGTTPSHLQWISNIVLHLSWATRFTLNPYSDTWKSFMVHPSIPLGGRLNCFLTCCNLIGSPIGKEVLEIEDKSDRLEQTLNQVSRAIASTLNSNHPTFFGLLSALTELRNRPSYLTEMAYGWCSMMWKTPFSRANPFPLALEIGFRDLDPFDRGTRFNFTHVVHDQNLINEVFTMNRTEAIADLLQALTVRDSSGDFAHTSLGFCARHIIDLHKMATVQFSSRLRKLVILSVELLGREGFNEAEPELFVDLLNHLDVLVTEMDSLYDWPSILVETIRSTEGNRLLVIRVWELLAEFATWRSQAFAGRTAYDSHVTESLLEAGEWKKLECWLGVVWMAWFPGADDMTEDLQRATMQLFRRKPDAVQKLTQWMERWSKVRYKAIPESFQKNCEEARRDAASSLPPDRGAPVSTCP